MGSIIETEEECREAATQFYADINPYTYAWKAAPAGCCSNEKSNRFYLNKITDPSLTSILPTSTNSRGVCRTNGKEHMAISRILV